MRSMGIIAGIAAPASSTKERIGTLMSENVNKDHYFGMMRVSLTEAGDPPPPGYLDDRENLWIFSSIAEAFDVFQDQAEKRCIGYDKIRLYIWNTEPWISGEDPTVRDPDSFFFISPDGRTIHSPYPETKAIGKYKVELIGTRIILYWNADEKELVLFDRDGIINEKPITISKEMFFEIRIDGKGLGRINAFKYLAVLFHVHLRFGGTVPPSLLDFMKEILSA